MAGSANQDAAISMSPSASREMGEMYFVVQLPRGGIDPTPLVWGSLAPCSFRLHFVSFEGLAFGHGSSFLCLRSVEAELRSDVRRFFFLTPKQQHHLCFCEETHIG